MIIALLLASCTDTGSFQKREVTPTAKPKVSPPRKLIVSGVLTVGSYTNYPPQTFIDPKTQEETGFDIDLIKAIGQRMGLKVEVVHTEFSSLINLLMNNNIDVAISAIPMTSEFQEKAQFVSYFKGGEALMVEHGNPLNIISTADLCGRNVGVQIDSIEQSDLQIASETCKRQGKPAIKVIAQQDQQAVIQLLLSKRVVAVYQDAPIVDYAIKQHPGRFQLGGPITNVTFQGIAVRKDNSDMLKAVQAAFEEIRKDGTYRALIMKWGLIHGDITEKKK